MIQAIVPELIHNPQHLPALVNKPFHEVEPASPKQQLANKLSQQGDALLMIGRVPEEKDPHEGHQPDDRMKQSIPDHVHMHGFEGRRGHPVGEHIIPTVCPSIDSASMLSYQ